MKSSSGIVSINCLTTSSSLVNEIFNSNSKESSVVLNKPGRISFNLLLCLINKNRNNSSNLFSSFNLKTGETMDKTILKTFAVNSRNKLIEDTIYRLSLLGITEDEIQDPIEANGMQTFQIGGTNFSIYDDDINKRKEIIEDIESKGFNNFVEEVAYTWFNRIIAIRYMEVNNYLPTKTRVLSSETEGKIEPDILTDALDIDLDYTQEEKELIFKL